MGLTAYKDTFVGHESHHLGSVGWCVEHSSRYGRGMGTSILSHNTRLKQARRLVRTYTHPHSTPKWLEPQFADVLLCWFGGIDIVTSLNSHNTQHIHPVCDDLLNLISQTPPREARKTRHNAAALGMYV